MTDFGVVLEQKRWDKVTASIMKMNGSLPFADEFAKAARELGVALKTLTFSPEEVAASSETIPQAMQKNRLNIAD